jgi:hypothetical protein
LRIADFPQLNADSVKRQVFVAVLSNSFVVKQAAKPKHKGIRIELGGNGKRFKTNVVLSRDYQSLDMQKFAA